MRNATVAAAVVCNDRGEFLLAQRPPSKTYAGYWEFPGGKLEDTETAVQALLRELEEELGIRATIVYPWITRDHDYAQVSVRLHFYRVLGWEGKIEAREEQSLAWQSIEHVTVEPLLPANIPILRSLSLPTVCGITRAGDVGTGPFLEQLKRALHGGLRMIQVREKTFTSSELRRFVLEVVALAREYGARVVVNGTAAIAEATGADGIHLTAERLMQMTQRPHSVDWCGASCHNVEELQRAAALGFDYAILGAVQPTMTHPSASALGWERFAQQIQAYPLPVYAIGGLCAADISTAWRHGAHGIALLRAAW